MSISEYNPDKRDCEVHSNDYQSPSLKATGHFIKQIGNQYAFNGNEYMTLVQKVLNKGKTEAAAKGIDLTDLSSRALKVIIQLKEQVQSPGNSKIRDSEIDEAAGKIINFLVKLKSPAMLTNELI